ncbi:TPA: hypothetical protein PKT77_002096 [Acinetobacter baumannii]|uniref:hypothetical protein n=1 Tax=Acinetobacter baumannii TaxID=470 RepID=UPI00165F9532|nr:hypothetical protein [Acinetobacter baumannii]EHU2953335.1 hypothetical protein [Acinetobacter baumannii]MBD0078948.1 hypothetical protein [Acinetobacter baumannii]MBP4674442.1 hypothetical protein [Acinetobacter baumannii]MBP5036095.1 hypothetical protein [Acinetobacter baumannii]MCA4084744.1 hypothetical protein [Acinetobacter baumannii]
MMSIDQTKALQVCENILLDKKASNIQAHILPSENIIIDRLLERKVELQHAYRELYLKLGKYHQALRSFLEIFVSITSMHNPEEIVKSRSAQKQLNEVNQQIAVKAHELANLLESRSELTNTSDFMTPTHYHIGNVIREASQSNPYFRSHLQAELKLLQGRFDFKYWPQLHELIRVIAEDARVALPTAIDSVTQAATSGERASLADYFRALFEAIECNRQKEYGFLPDDFKLTDSSIATLVNCALLLEPEEMIDGPYVKNFRSRERKRLNSGF